jgi:4-diphosphocytidyl-2-C-methyl-D-erythritol kinase
MLTRQDGPTVTVWAPAKLNLFLKILGPRPDGYHELVTLIAAVDRYDTLILKARETTELSLDGRWATAYAPRVTGSPNSGFDPLPPAEDNLVMRALRLLQTASGCRRGAHVELIKRIPPASGLGGGSSDAAAALLAANRAWELRYSRSALADLAAQLGSDVPFFLNHWQGDGATLAVCRGRGEEVVPARAPAGLHFVIARPAGGLSTVEVYRRYKVSRASAAQNAASATPEPNVDALLAALQRGDTAQAAANFVNDLQPPAAAISPAIAALASEFAQLQPLVHQMSGSGSAYFGWFRHAAAARRAAGQLRGRGYPHVWHVQTI